jgi:hypothetical protein
MLARGEPLDTIGRDMRLHWGAVPDSPDFTPLEPWRPLREPSLWLSQAIALPFGVAAAVGVVYLWLAMTPLQDVGWRWSPLYFLPLLAGLVVTHELLHAAAHPFAGRSANSILGVWPSRILFYAYYDGELTRERVLAIALMPLLVISFLPLLVAAIVHAEAQWEWLAFASFLNTLASGGDLLGIVIILWQVPAGATVRNRGWRTYWRAPAGKGG